MENIQYEARGRNHAAQTFLNSSEANAVHHPKVDFAVDAGTRGLRAYPLKPNSAEPLIENWNAVATTDADQIRACWELCPDANIGIANRGLLAIRITEEATKTEIDEFSEFLRACGGKPVATARTLVDGGEGHILFSLPAQVTVEARARLFGSDGISVLSSQDDTVIIGPGSTIHGSRCKFTSKNLALAPAPAALLELCGVTLPAKTVAATAPKRDAVIEQPTAARGVATIPRAPSIAHLAAAEENPKLEAALAGARRGFDIIPCVENTKAPAIKKWTNRGTQDPAEIRRMWTEYPNANIGGVTNNFIVVDIDRRNGGIETFAALADLYDFPKTLRHKTQGGGYHLIYAAPDGGVKKETHKLGRGIDIQARGGQILLPGSTIDGRSYECIDDRPIAPAPAWLIELCKKARPKNNKAGKRVVEEDDTAIAQAEHWMRNHAPRAELGERNNIAFRVATGLLDYGVSFETQTEMMLGWNETSCDPPLDDEELNTILESSRQSRGNPIGCKHRDAPGFEAVEIDEGKRPQPATSDPAINSPRPFSWGEPADLWIEHLKPAPLPSNVLPDILERAARDRGRRLGVEPGAPAAALVTVLASLVPAGNRLQMRQRDTDWTVKPILWTAIVGPPGSNKSATIGYAVSTAGKLETGWRKAFVAAERQRKADEARRAAARGDPERPAEPTLDGGTKPRFRQKLFNDATTEALAASLAENPEGLLYHADELAGWLGNMDAYRAKGGKDRPFWLQAKEGGPLTINRKTSDRICVENCAISVLGGIQPDKLRSLKVGMSDDGLLQRFAPILIRRNGNGVDIPPDAETTQRLAAAAASIVESENGGLFRFSPEADAELQATEAFKAAEIARPDSSSILRQWLDKTPNEFGRLALTFHFVEWHTSQLGADIGGSPPPEISQGTAERARRYLAEFVYPHARAFYLKELGTAEVDEHAKWIAGFALSRGLKAIKTRDIYRSYPALRAPERRGAIPTTMRVLEMFDWVRPIGERRGVEDEWEINPAAHDGRFEEIAAAEKSRRFEVRCHLASPVVTKVGDKKITTKQGVRCRLSPLSLARAKTGRKHT